MKHFCIVLAMATFALAPTTLEGQSGRCSPCSAPTRPVVQDTNKVQNASITGLQTSRREILARLDELNRRAPSQTVTGVSADTSLVNELARQKNQLISLENQISSLSLRNNQLTEENKQAEDKLRAMNESIARVARESNHSNHSNRSKASRDGMSTGTKWGITGGVALVTYLVGQNNGWWNGRYGGNITNTNAVCVGASCR